MKKLAALLLCVSVLISGCAELATPHSEQKKQDEPVDRNRNSVPDSLERKAVPLEPVINQPLKSPAS